MGQLQAGSETCQIMSNATWLWTNLGLSWRKILSRSRRSWLHISPRWLVSSNGRCSTLSLRGTLSSLGRLHLVSRAGVQPTAPSVHGASENQVLSLKYYLEENPITQSRDGRFCSNSKHKYFTTVPTCQEQINVVIAFLSPKTQL